MKRVAQKQRKGRLSFFIDFNVFIRHRSLQFFDKYLTIIPRGCVGHEMMYSQLGATRLVGYNHLIFNKPEWNNCFIKNNHQISLKSCHVLFRKILSWTAKRFSSAAIVSPRGKKFQNFSCYADAYTYHICRTWCNILWQLSQSNSLNCIIQ